jgi:hypothetical protein
LNKWERFNLQKFGHNYKHFSSLNPFREPPMADPVFLRVQQLVGAQPGESGAQSALEGSDHPEVAVADPSPKLLVLPPRDPLAQNGETLGGKKGGF